jgi:CRISPR/Cas system-associated exonuclease Cas4 (RecB family)
MRLPVGFQFSQSSLQDYVDCQRRFQLHSILHLDWPAVEAEPVLENERFLQLGASFHYLIRQHQLGIPVERLTASIQSTELQQWWENYLAAITPGGELAHLMHPNELRLPEVSLTTPLSHFRLVAKFDLLVIQVLGKATIIDWKTSRKRPKRQWLLDRLQTRVYQYLLTKAGNQFNHGKPISPEQIEMLYFFADFPAEPEIIEYSSEQYAIDEGYLIKLVENIEGWGDNDFPLTHNDQYCHFCVYRSLCDRGIQAGSLSHADDTEELLDVFTADFSLEQVNEVEY